MHQTAYIFGEGFFQTYAKDQGPIRVLEIGSQSIDGRPRLRDHKPNNCIEYVGVDFEKGPNVDLVLFDRYSFAPLKDNTFDFVVSTSCFEHSEMFWLTFLEGMRILKPSGVMYCNAPSAWMGYHRYPVDCWRFWPDAAKGLQSWGRRNGMQTQVLESFIGMPDLELMASDWVAVFIKDVSYIDRYPNRMVDILQPFQNFFNGYRYPSNNKFPDGWDKLVAHYSQGQSPVLEFTNEGIIQHIRMPTDYERVTQTVDLKSLPINNKKI